MSAQAPERELVTTDQPADAAHIKDAKQLPVCQACLDIYHQPGDNRDDREELPDA